MKGVVFLSYSASERGERWSPRGTGWVVSMFPDLCVCVYVCVNDCGYMQESPKEKRSSLCKVSNHGNNEKKLLIFCISLTYLFLKRNTFSFPQSAASILVSLLFHTKLTHAHSLRFLSLWPAEWGVDQNDCFNRVAARVLKQHTPFSQCN